MTEPLHKQVRRFSKVPDDSLYKEAALARECEVGYSEMQTVLREARESIQSVREKYVLIGQWERQVNKVIRDVSMAESKAVDGATEMSRIIQAVNHVLRERGKPTGGHPEGRPQSQT